MSSKDVKLEDKLEELMDMVDENRALLKKIEQRMRVNQAIKVVYWVIIVGLGVLGYYAAQPYLERIQGAYQGIQSSVDSVSDIFQRD